MKTKGELQKALEELEAIKKAHLQETVKLHFQKYEAHQKPWMGTSVTGQIKPLPIEQLPQTWPLDAPPKNDFIPASVPKEELDDMWNPAGRQYIWWQECQKCGKAVKNERKSKSRPSSKECQKCKKPMTPIAYGVHSGAA